MARGDRNYSYKTDTYSVGLVFTILISSELRDDVAKRYETFESLRDHPEKQPLSKLEKRIPNYLKVEWKVVENMLQYDVANR